MPKIALIDGDIVAWKAAATTERTEYEVLDQHFRYKKEAVAWCEQEGVPTEEIQPVLVEEPFEITESNCRSLLTSVMDNTGAEEYRMFLTGKDNYREALSKTRVYKGNRTKPKPVRLPATKEYLMEGLGAEVVDGCEADDMLGILQGEDTVICSIDKDLRCIPGLHYNLDKQEVTEVTPTEAWYNFWFQVLTGDSTDNIEGLPGCGVKTAEALLGEPVREGRDEVEYAKELRAIVEEAYAKTLGEDAEERLREMASLVWIQRDPGDYTGWDRGTS